MRAPLALTHVLGEALQARIDALLAAREAAREIEEAGTAVGVDEGPVPVDPDLFDWLPTMQVLTAEAERPLGELAKALKVLSTSEGAWGQTEGGPRWEESPRGILLDHAAARLERVISKARYARAAAEVLDSLKRES